MESLAESIDRDQVDFDVDELTDEELRLFRAVVSLEFDGEATTFKVINLCNNYIISLILSIVFHVEF